MHKLEAKKTVKKRRTTRRDVAAATDRDLTQLLKVGEAGVGDLMRVYEEIERVYVTATPAEGFLPESGYATGTLHYAL